MTDKPDLYAALSDALGEMPELTKDAAVDTGKFSYNYLSLDSLIAQVRPVLSSHGLSVFQSPEVTDTGHFVLTTFLAHSSGQALTFRMPLPVPDGADAKAWGSWITYFRRYGLLSVLFLAPGEDDDGARTAPPSHTSETGGAATSGRAEPPGSPANPQTAAGSQARPDEPPIEPTALQHAKLNAMLAELEEKDPHPGQGGETWLDMCKAHVKEKYGKKSRTELTRVEMTELIDTIQRWGYEKGIPF